PPALGSAHDFAAFIDACHEAGLAVVVEWDAPAPFAQDDDDSLFLENVLVDSALHWLETFHVDGLSMQALRRASSLIERLREEIERTAPGAALIVEDAALSVDNPAECAPPGANVWRPD